ncbi:MAG: hypothetical protein U9R16_00865 [Campylobacterota bacterium]|nr:hypothetical protein [Campylobacterota bacterium]
MKKKAYINIILLGSMLFVAIIVFVSTTADDIVWKNKYFNLQKIVDSHASALAKGYHVHKNELESVDPVAGARVIANNILNNSPLGAEVDASDYIDDSFCFKNDLTTCSISDECTNDSNCRGEVTATITNYQHDNFWYRFLGKDQFELDVVAREMLLYDPNHLYDFLPIAINGCTKDYYADGIVGQEFDFILSAHDKYTDDNNTRFYALSEPGGGQSSYAHFKNMIADILDNKTSEFDLNSAITTISNVDYDDMDNDVKQVSQSFDITDLTDTEMSIVVLDCNSTAIELDFQGSLPILLTDVYCAPDEVLLETALSNGVDVFGADDYLYWAKTTPSCNSTSYFRIHFEVLEATDNTSDSRPTSD